MKDLATIVANDNPADVEALKNCTYPGTDRTVADVTADKVLSIGENIQIRRFIRYADGVNVPYIHMGGKVAVLVNLEVEGIEAGKVTELGKDVAMQICAMNPAFLDKSDVDQATLDKEKEIQLAVMANDPKMASKPDKVKEGIVMGKLGKYYEENCLLQQAFVKENKVKLPRANVSAEVTEVGDGVARITVKSDKYARFVRLWTPLVTSPFSDNFFDLLPGESVGVSIDIGNADPEEFKRTLAVHHLAQTEKAVPRLVQNMRRLGIFLIPVNFFSYLYYGAAGIQRKKKRNAK